MTRTRVPDDAANFGRLLRQHDSRMRAVAHGMLGSQSCMDDALQDAYLKAWRARSSFRGDAAFSTWLQRIVINSCLDQVRRRVVTLRSLDDHDPPDPHDGADRRLPEVDALTHALQQLPADRRIAVLLVDQEGMSYADAATVLECAEGTVASRVHRGRAELRSLLSDEVNR